MLTMTAAEIGYVAASFQAWCRQHGKSRPGIDDARAYFIHAGAHEPAVAEFLDDDWEDFAAFLAERHLIAP